MVNSSNYNPWIKCYTPNPNATLRLFCLPYAGAGTSIYRTWSNNLPTNIEVCAIQLPGREDRFKEPPFTNILPLVETLTQVLRPYLNIPYAFFGHSMGALISFELARQLRIQQAPCPVHLFVSGRRAPQIPDRNPLIHTLPEKEFLAELRLLNGTPKNVLESEFMQLLLPTLRADFSICGTYAYLHQPPLDCSISAFAGTEDSTETYELIQSWKEQTNSSFSPFSLPGNHFFIQTSRQILLEKLSVLVAHIINFGGLTGNG